MRMITLIIFKKLQIGYKDTTFFLIMQEKTKKIAKNYKKNAKYLQICNFMCNFVV